MIKILAGNYYHLISDNIALFVPQIGYITMPTGENSETDICQLLHDSTAFWSAEKLPQCA